MNKPITLDLTELLAPVIEQLEERWERRFAALEEKYKTIAEKAMTEQQVCEHLGISRSTLYNLRKSGEIKSLSVGGKVRFRRKDIEEFMARQVAQQNARRRAPLKVIGRV